MLDFLLLFLLGLASPTNTENTDDTSTSMISEEVQEVQETTLVTATPVATENEDILPQPTMTDEKLLQGGAVKDDETIAIIHTNKGDIVLRFFPEAAPKTVENFVGLAKKEYYNGVIFHRIIDGFMIQGGDPTGTGRGGESFFGGNFADEFSDTAKNNIGSISMANAGPGTNGSQFFINTANNNFLDNRHSVFGEVVAGMNIVDILSQVKTNGADKPFEDVVMNSVEITTFKEYKESTK